MTTPDERLSLAMQAFASSVHFLLRTILGTEESVPFIVMVAPESECHYVANVSREDGIKMIKGTLARWQDPGDLPDLALHQKEEMILKLLAACRAYHVALDTAFVMLIEATRGVPVRAPPFFPSKSPMWPAIVAGKEVMDQVEAALAFSRELATTSSIEVPPASEQH